MTIANHVLAWSVLAMSCVRAADQPDQIPIWTPAEDARITARVAAGRQRSGWWHADSASWRIESQLPERLSAETAELMDRVVVRLSPLVDRGRNRRDEVVGKPCLRLFTDVTAYRRENPLMPAGIFHARTTVTEIIGLADGRRRQQAEGLVLDYLAWPQAQVLADLSRTVLVHEGVHFLVQRATGGGRTPRWLTEGLATLLAKADLDQTSEAIARTVLADAARRHRLRSLLPEPQPLTAWFARTDPETGTRVQFNGLDYLIAATLTAHLMSDRITLMDAIFDRLRAGREPWRVLEAAEVRDLDATWRSRLAAP